ncbi:MAG: hypothetical protein ACI9U2_001877 [Bradymonadia bacterium]|jgi:hypothetical protein
MRAFSHRGLLTPVLLTPLWLTPFLLLLAGGLSACDPVQSVAEDARTLGDAGARDDAFLRDRGVAMIVDLGLGDAEPLPYDPRLNSLIPNRGELTGGTRVRIVGRDFRNGMQVEFADRACTEIELESENHLRCTVPRGAQVGSVPVTVRWADRTVEPAVLPNGFTYYREVTIGAVEPNADAARGGIQVLISGTGLIDPTEVRFGDTQARIVEIRNLERMVVLAPPHVPGVVDVRVRNVNGDSRLVGAFTYTEDLVIDDVTPRFGSVAGGEEVRLSGAGLLLSSLVELDAAPADVLASELDRQRLTIRTPPHAPGMVDVRVTNTNGEFERPGAFLYLPDDDGDFALHGVVPNRLPDIGNQPFVVGGNGFTDEAEVSVDGVAVPCERDSAQVLRCIADPHAPGPVDVRVVDGGRSATLPNAITFFEKIEVFDVRPARGARSGGTLVQLIGRGFAEDMRLEFDGAPLVIDTVISTDEAYARTPPGRPGTVGMLARRGDDVAFLPEAFEYFDPYSRFGGVWGEPIVWSVNVTVLDGATGDPVPAAQVRVLPVGAIAAYTGLTDELGQAVVSDRAVTSPASVTVAKPGYEIFTIERVTAQNVTVYITPHVIEAGMGNPPDPIPPSRISGSVNGIDALQKPLEPGLVLAAFVETTHSSMYNRQSLPWSEPNGILFEDGDFEIFCRPGQIAVVVTAGYIRQAKLQEYRDGQLTYWSMRDALVPIAMGYQRYISVSPGDLVEEITVNLDRPMDLETPVTLLNPSGGAPPAPSFYEAEAIIDFGAEGYWALDTQIEGPSTQLLMRNMPDMNDWEPDMDLRWIGTARQAGDAWLPYTVTFVEDRDVTDGVVIGPFVGTPRLISPVDGGALGPNRLIRWELYDGADGPAEPAHANIISITSFRGLPLWTHITPGAVTQYRLPDLPPEFVLDAEGMNLTIVPVIRRGGFDFDDFGLSDLGFNRRRSYGVTRVNFTP